MTVYIQTTTGGRVFPPPPVTALVTDRFVTVDHPKTFTTIVNGVRWQRRRNTGITPPPPPGGATGFGAAGFGAGPYGG